MTGPDLESRVFALEEAVARLEAKHLPEPRRRRWSKRKLYEAIKPLRETGEPWDKIGACFSISGERCRQVWRLFNPNVGQPIDVAPAGDSALQGAGTMRPEEA